MSIPLQDRILGGLWGLLVGDALGVPVEFEPRSDRNRDPVGNMRGFGTHDQPPGTWSDDGAMTLCTVESLRNGLNIQDLAGTFLRWYHHAHWTAHGHVFDIGIATRAALGRISRGIEAEHAGGSTERDNGNGALMRMLPVALKFWDRPVREAFSIAAQVSSITHGHERSRLACGLHNAFASALLQGLGPENAYTRARNDVRTIFEECADEERRVFGRILSGALARSVRDDIDSTGYVVDTLEVAIWSLLQGGNFSDVVLRAINLGDDTDTSGAVTGGLAGILVGIGGIPSHWRAALPRQHDLHELFASFVAACPSANAHGNVVRP